MRKFVVWILLFLSLSILNACGKQPDGKGTQPASTQKTELSSSAAQEDETDTETESGTESEPETEREEVPEKLVNLTTHYIRGADNSIKEDIPKIIRTMEEYEEYCEQASEFISKTEFQLIAKRFDKSFWENYDLLIVRLVAGDTGARFDVLSMTREGGASDADWVINVRPMSWDDGAAVLTPWQFLIEVPEGALKEEEIRINGAKDSRGGVREGNFWYLRTDMWKPEDGDSDWYLGESPTYFMDTKEELEAYCDAHPELSEGFLNFARGLAMSFGRNRIWHFFIEVETSGRLKAEDVIRIHNRDTYVEDEAVIDAQYYFSENNDVVAQDPKIHLISSQEQLDQYYETNKDKYNLPEKAEEAKSVYDSWERFIRGYHPVFWEQNDLILVVLEGDVGRRSYDVTAVEWPSDQSGGCKLTIERRGYSEEPSLAYRHFFLTVPKGKVTDPGAVSLEFVDVN